MKHIYILIAIGISTFTNLSWGQNEGNNWYFGSYAALNFNSGSPVVVTGSSLTTQEGSSSISDASGNLLFYTDGVQVWNKNNIQMPNGYGLLGHASTTQSALIIPMPGSSTKYYIFTIYELGGDMKYSIVDMTLNGGYGDVIAKNTPLHATVSEKQTAIKRCDGNIWVISHNWGDNTFYADLVTPTGINPSVTSSVGISHVGGIGTNYNSVGQMKVSPQGDKIAVAIRDVAVFELLDFDINTGVVSNSMPLNMGSYPIAYGVEFSPDGSKLYGTTITNSNLIQFDLSSGTQIGIESSATVIGNTTAYAGQLQLASNGKIYVAQCYSQAGPGINSLGVINNPNLLGAPCAYIQNGLSLNSEQSLLGLPTIMVQNQNLQTLSVSNDTSICKGASVLIGASGATSYQWSGGSSATTDSILVSPSATTSYIVTANNVCGNNVDTVTITVGSPITVNAGNDTSICSGSSIVLSGTGAGTGGTYSWNNGISNGVSFIPPGTATYTVTGTSSAGCTDSDQITVTVNPLPAVNAGPDQTICSGSQAVLNASGATSYSWNNGVTDGVPFTPPTGINTYTVTGTNSNGCVSTDQVNVNVGASIPVNAGSDVAICMGGSVTLNGSGAGIGGTYTWSNGVTNGVSFSPIASATYTVTGTASGGCIGSDQVTVTVNPLPIISAGSDQTICSGEQAVLNGSGGVSYSWNNGVNNGASFSPPIGTTNYTVTGTDANGCVNTDNVSITVNPSPNMNAGPNQSICIGGTVVLTASGTGAVSYSWNNGVQNGVAFSPSITQSYILTGTGANGCTDTDSVTVTVNPLPNINVNDTAVCIGQQLVLQGNGAVNYSWSNGIQNGIAFVPDSGSTTYIVTGTDANGCVSSDTMTVTASSHPNAAFTAAPTSGDQPLVVDITNTSTGATAYYWDFGNGNTQTTLNLGGLSQTYVNDGTYYIILTADNNGCIDTAMVQIVVETGALSYHIPNILTPNGDGQNDIFHFSLVNAAALDIEIYNRWGNWMQSIKDIQNANGWNGKTSQGKDADEGTYFFTYVITDLHEKTVKGHGFVELVRK